MAKMINLTINGKQVSVSDGTLLVNAAKLAGIDIPVFCYHPKMEPVGMCRMCLVEIGRPLIDRTTGQPVLDEKGAAKIQFGPKLETACTTPVSDGMLVLTNSEKALNNQKEVVELLLTSHPLDCPICDKGGECPLQNLTMRYGPGQSRFLYDEKLNAAKRVPLGELIYLDRERCIQCARCVRFQDDIVGEPVLGFYQRGRATDIVTFSEPGFDSIFSGNTTDICPVGALTTSDFRFGARPWELNQAASICTQCPVGCNITFNTRREVRSGGGYSIKRVMPRQNEQVNEIWLCDKGRFAGYQYTESAQRLVESLVKQNGSLTTAPLQTTLDVAATQLALAKSEAVFLASGRLSNEDLYNIKKLAGELGGETLLYTTMGGGEYTTAYGMSNGSNLGALGKGSTILVVASDIHDEAPVWYLRIKAAAKRGATLIVANTRATKLDEFATFVVRYANGDEAETIKGLSQKDKIGEALIKAENLVIFYGSDGLSVEGSAVLAETCVGLIKDHAGNPNSGLIGVWSRVNEQGAWELGFRPALDLKEKIKGKVLYLAGVDLVGDDPAYIDILKQAKFIIVQDLFLTETGKLADAVLPVLAYTEREGTYTTAERRVQRFYPAVSGNPALKADYALTADIARQIGLQLEGRSPLLVMNQIATDEVAFFGINYAGLAEVEEQFPIVGRGDMYYGGTTYENSQGLGMHLRPGDIPFSAFEQKEEKLRPSENELIAVPVSKVYDRGTTMVPAIILAGRTGEPSIVLNPVTASKLGIANGDQVKVSLNDVEAEIKVKLDKSIQTGVVLVYRSFGVPISGPVPLRIIVAEKAQGGL